LGVLLASELSARVESLIARHHRGNRRAAAHQLGIEPERLDGLLSGDWRRFTLDALAALVRGYQVNLHWLLASTTGTAAGVPALVVGSPSSDLEPRAKTPQPRAALRSRVTAAARGASGRTRDAGRRKARQ
jgi:hypothetical protein